jgi:hypothetical protein
MPVDRPSGFASDDARSALRAAARRRAARRSLLAADERRSPPKLPGPRPLPAGARVLLLAVDNPVSRLADRMARALLRPHDELQVGPPRRRCRRCCIQLACSVRRRTMRHALS